MIKHRIVVIGSGVAGLTCAMYLAQAHYDVCVVGCYADSSLCSAPLVRNYPGIDQCSGDKIVEKMFTTVKNDLKVPIYDSNVIDFGYRSDYVGDYMLTLDSDKSAMRIIYARYVVVATGVTPVVPEYAKDFIGHGVHTCAICDGALYKNKHVVVVGSGSTAIASAEYLSKIASGVTLLHRRQKLSSWEYRSSRASISPNITSVVGTADSIVRPADRSDKLMLHLEGTDSFMVTNGVFYCIGGRPNTDFLKTANSTRDGALLTPGGAVRVMQNRTCMDRLYACGDVTSSAVHKQAAIAAADGIKTALIIISNLNND